MKRKHWLIGILSISVIIAGFGGWKMKQDWARAQFLNSLHLDIPTNTENAK